MRFNIAEGEMRVRFCPERSASVSQQYANLVLTIYVVRSYWVKMAIFAPMRKA